MRKRMRPLVVTVVMVVAISLVASAQWLKLSTGVLVEAVVWQTSPAPFADFSQWGGVSLSLLLGALTLDAAVSVTDFETLTISKDPTVYLVGKIAVGHWGPATVELGAGLSVTPTRGWMALDVGLGATILTPIPYTEIRTRLLCAWTPGGGHSPAGVGAAIDLGLFVSIPLY